ncbi:MAG: hypothetical protein GY849_02570 [Deltaproteobacteria bacterium]|nr:hypothetical protein [Deltaproteobacteria bacterium]
MKKLTIKDLKKLKYGEQVLKFEYGEARELDFVGFVPKNKNHLIFCKGSYLTLLYLNEKDNNFKGDWYGGEYTFEHIWEFIGKLKVEWLENEIKQTKKTYKPFK